MNPGLLDVALECIGRGWFVFPCRPKSKEPAVAGGFKSATNDPEKIREWWSRWPDANVGIATGASGLCVLDVDTGLAGEADAQEFLRAAGIGSTYTVRTGRRPGFAMQVYFLGAGLRSAPWKDPENPDIAGDIRCSTGYVMAAGSVHPSGELYEVWDAAELDFTPEYVQNVAAASREILQATDDGGPITEWRNDKLARIAGKLRNAGLHNAALDAAVRQINADRCQPPLDEDEVARIIHNACKWDVPADEPPIILGSNLKKAVEVADNKEPTPWRERFHSYDEMLNAPPLSWHIEGFLPVETITALAAPVAQRKSIIALNIAHALCTGEALFDHFEVKERPERVVYLCPEMGIRAFTKRLKAIGLMEYVGKTLFCQTMSSEEPYELDGLPDEALQGAVVIVDTVVRFLKGDENSSEHMRAFSDSVMSLTRRGAKCVVLLHHSGKGTSEAGELTLQNALRGSGEIGAFITSCWATRLQDPTEPYSSASYLVNVKQRDFESEPFEATSNENCKMTIVGAPGAVRLQAKAFKQAPPDPVADAIIKANPKAGAGKLVELLREQGSRHGKDWVLKRKAELKEPGASGSVLRSD